MSVMRNHVEQRIAKNRKAEAKGMELRKMLVQDNIIAGHGRSNVHVEGLRSARANAAERQDLWTDYGYVRGQQESARKTFIAEAEEKLANSLAAQKSQNYREEMNRRRICDGSEELRSLKEKLHAAQVNKERAQQLLTQHIKQDEQTFREHKIAEHMENERLEHQELEHKLHMEKQNQRHRVKHVNQRQMAQKEAKREEALKEHIREKDQVQELVEKIDLEDRMEADARAQKRKETKETLARFMREQKARQEEMEEQQRQETEKIEQYARDKAFRDDMLVKQKEDEAKEKERILRGQIGDMELANKQKGELDQLRNDLHQEEVEAEFRRREETTMRKHLEDKDEMRKAYSMQARLKEEKKARASNEEAKIREQLLAKFAEDDRIEQMNESKRRMKVQEHKREADRLIEIRRQSYEDSRLQEREAQEALRKQEMDRQVVIEAERQRLLREHASQLRDFLPKGTLECKEDLVHVFPQQVGIAAA